MRKQKSFALHYLRLFVIVLSCDASIQALTKGVRHSSLSSHFAFSTGRALFIYAVAMPLSLLFGKRRLIACALFAAALLGLNFCGR